MQVISLNPEMKNVPFISNGAASKFRHCVLFADLVVSKEQLHGTSLPYRIAEVLLMELVELSDKRFGQLSKHGIRKCWTKCDVE
jgi:hypothetical protein